MNKKIKIIALAVILGILTVGVVFVLLPFRERVDQIKPDEEKQEVAVLEPLSQDFQQAITQFTTPEILIAYLNEHFAIENREELGFYPPEMFFQKRAGMKQDFAIFISYVLSRKHETAVLQYQYRDEEGKGRVETLVVFRDDEPRYIFFDDEKLTIFNYDWSFDALLAQEAARLNVDILLHNFFSPGDTNLLREVQ